MDSHELMARAQRRITKLGDGVERHTLDPLRAEIALAQVDATLAVAAAILKSSEPYTEIIDGLRRENRLLIEELRAQYAREREGIRTTPEMQQSFWEKLWRKWRIGRP